MAHRWELSPVLLAKGAVIGVANIIPGVSGGTIAVVLGLYDRLVESISSLTRPSRASLATHLPFLAQLTFGALCSIILLSTVMDYLYTEHMHPTVFFFMGLIIGSVPTIIRQHTDMRPSASNIALLAVGALAILSLSLVNADIAESETGSSNGDVALLFVAGMAGAAAMIVPGFSGSFMLVALGVYWHLLEAVRGGDMLTLIPAIAGGLVGIIVVSRGLEVLLHRYPSQFYYCILGLIIASLYEIYPGMPTGAVLVASIATLLAGVAVSLSLSG